MINLTCSVSPLTLSHANTLSLSLSPSSYLVHDHRPRLPRNLNPLVAVAVLVVALPVVVVVVASPAFCGSGGLGGGKGSRCASMCVCCSGGSSLSGVVGAIEQFLVRSWYIVTFFVPVFHLDSGTYFVSFMFVPAYPCPSLKSFIFFCFWFLGVHAVGNFERHRLIVPPTLHS